MHAENILKYLKETEREAGIKILYACESGSRAWGFPSPDSDYDVRFLYVRPLEWYLHIYEKPGTLEFPINDELDLAGWDLKKALQLAHRSNAVIWEWLQSPIIYLENGDFRKKFVPIASPYFSPIAGCGHYLAQAKKGIEATKDASSLKIKKYFYIIRPILAALWVCENKSIPPMEILPLLEQNCVTDALRDEVNQLIERKAKALEGEMVNRLPTIDSFIETYVTHCEERLPSLPTSKKPPLDPLDKFLCESLGC